MMTRDRLLRHAPAALALLLLLAVYLPTLQTIPNGSDHYYMIDVGEAQIVLNTWGTLHATGYPLYVMSGNVLVTLFKALGASPTAAPALVSLLWGMIALGLLYALAVNLTDSPLLSASVIALFGLTRTVWMHHVIAEVYTFGLALLALLLLLALWGGEIRGRIYWLALVGGIGVAHHRGLAMAAPALVFAEWSELTAQPRQVPRILFFCLLLGLIGFLPYLYLPLRDLAGGAWVYGEPGTWSGFWDQFFGREASRFIGPPSTLDGVLTNVGVVNEVLLTDLTLPGLVAGLGGLALGIATPRLRRAALTFTLSGLVAYLFHALFYTDVLSALILAVTLSVAFGWLLGAAWLLERARAGGQRWGVLAVTAIGALMFGVTLYTQNAPFVQAEVSDPTGLESIALAHETPPGATLMIAWGHRHFAVGFARDVLGELQDITLVNHKADFAALVREGLLVTPDYTFYNQPIAWWEERIGAKVYLRAAAPHLVEIGTTPEHADVRRLDAVEASVECRDNDLLLRVMWAALATPTEDWSVFVHLLDASGNVLAQADQSAPVYGWRPLTTWEPTEAIRDIYPLPRMTDAASVQYGLYHQLADGSFKNEIEHTIPVQCDE